MHTGFELLSNTELIDAYIGTYESKETRRVYKTELVSVDRLFKGKPFNQINKLDLIEYNHSITSKSDATRQRKHSTVRSFFLWLVWAGVVEEQNNPAKGTFKKITPHADIASKCLLQSEVETLMSISYPDARDFATIMVLATTGVRISELINMRWSDMFQAFDADTQKLEWYIKVVAKGNKLRNVWLREDAVSSLMRLNGRIISTERPGYIFTRLFGKTVTKLTPQGTRKAIKIIADKAGIKEAFTPHWFRHTFGTLGCSNGASIREMQANLGHASVRTTEKYLWSQNTKVAKYFPATFSAPA